MSVVERWAQAIGRSTAEAEGLVAALRAAIIAEAASVVSNPAQLEGIGRLLLTFKRGRTARSPKTGQPVKVPAKLSAKLDLAPGFVRDLTAEVGRAGRSGAGGSVLAGWAAELDEGAGGSGGGEPEDADEASA